MTGGQEILLEVTDLVKHFNVPRGVVRSVDGVSFSIRRGETLGLVGESGCGKTTAGRTIIRLYDVTSGSVKWKGHELASLSQKEMIPYRKELQMIFQDPYASLNPRMTVGDIVIEPMVIHGVPRDERIDRMRRLLSIVGLNSEHANRYPHEFSGGQRQRIGIARALALDPKFIVCDEPVSALDVSIQAQILNLLMDLQDNKGYTYMFITHDMSVVKHISDQIAVMYLGQCVELAPTKTLFNNPLHPYTHGLLNAIPIPSLKHRKTLHIMKGEVASPINPKLGCRFAARCPEATEECRRSDLKLREVEQGHFVACFKR